MKMEFVFDKNKLKKEGYDENKCFDAIRRYFDSCKSPTIKEIGKGIYEGSDDDWSAFGSSVRLTRTSWFLKVIKEWYWYVDEGDGLGEQKEDFLEAYYEINAVKA